MNILGISPLDKDSSVTLVMDGQISHAIAEERLSRRKMHEGFPYKAIETVMELAGIGPTDIDRVEYAFFDAPTESRLMSKNAFGDFTYNRRSGKTRERLSRLIREAHGRLSVREFDVHGLASAMENMPKGWLKSRVYEMASSDGLMGDLANQWQFRRWLKRAQHDHRNYQNELVKGLTTFRLQGKLKRREHHQSHIANAFYLSGFERALVVTLDAYGSGLAGSVSVADEAGIRRIHNIETPYSPGAFYETVTSALGFRPDRHAGKVVGLAAYGNPKILAPVLESLFEQSPGVYRMRRSSDVFLSRRLAREFPKIDLAAAYQHVLEKAVERYVGHYVKQTGLDAVVLSGGVTANVKLNQRIFELEGVKRIYIHPAMGDGGCGTGAAILTAVENGEQPVRLDDVYLGPEYSPARMEQALKRAGLAYRCFPDVESEIARLISEQNVVARFNGRMEYGPRALGNRSILYPATDPAVNQWLNVRLGRTEFMPFAPATLYEDRHRCYRNVDGAEFAAQFMTITFDCTDSMKETCPAAVHVDGTARPQLVTKSSNPSFHRIISEYKNLTGISSMINTSFNMHEEPIVCTPEDAIRAFTKGRLDYLAMGDFLVDSPGAGGSRNRSKQEIVV